MRAPMRARTLQARTRDADADADADAVADAVADAGAGADAVAVAGAGADAVVGARAAALAHDADKRCANVVERVEQLCVDFVDVAQRLRNVDASACLPR
jgi:hypothetical protein